SSSVNVEPVCPRLSADILATIDTGSLPHSLGAAGPAPAARAAPAGGPGPATMAAPPEEKEVEAKREESEESDDDMGFALF
ncbi:hypothetical protein PANDA_014718, partial [Ailuropoda melanoleuca]